MLWPFLSAKLEVLLGAPYVEINKRAGHFSQTRARLDDVRLGHATLYTLGLTFIFGPYFAGVAAEHYLSSGLDPTSAKANAQSIWSWGQAMAGFIVAIIGILAGAYADSTGWRMPWIWASSLVFVICSWMLWYMVPDGSAMWSSLIFFSIAFIAAELALVFTNAILPSLGDRREVGKISGSGAALGYAGGIISLFVMLFFFFDEGGKTFLIGLDPGFGWLEA